MSHPIGILSALPQELEALASKIQESRQIPRGDDHFVSGTLSGVPIVATLSGMGKVNASIASQRLVSEFNVKALIFTGVAGGTGRSLEIGDVLIGVRVFQHDVGFSGPSFTLHPPGVLPELGIGTGKEPLYFDLKAWPPVQTPESKSEDFVQAVSRILKSRENTLSAVTVDDQPYAPQIKTGVIATGDQFIANEQKKSELIDDCGADAVEMEGGAVAQVAERNGIPCLILRAISDKAGVHAKLQIQKVLATASSNNALLVLALLQDLQSYFLAL